MAVGGGGEPVQSVGRPHVALHAALQGDPAAEAEDAILIRLMAVQGGVQNVLSLVDAAAPIRVGGGAVGALAVDVGQGGMVGTGDIHVGARQGDGDGLQEVGYRAVGQSHEEGDGMGAGAQGQEGDSHGKAEGIRAARILDCLHPQHLHRHRRV